MSRKYEKKANDFTGVVLVKGVALGTLIQLSHLENAEKEKPYILYANKLEPSDTANINFKNIRGLILRIAGATSHAVILAKSFGIPLLLYSGVQELKENMTYLMDTYQNALCCEPKQEIIERALEEEKKRKLFESQLKETYKGKAYTKDGKFISIMANIGSVAEIQALDIDSIDGIGVFRTEFLFAGGVEPPSEDEHYKIYALIAEKMKGKPVVIRTFDIGGDKYVKFINTDHEDNPFLGYRAIRFLSCDYGIKLFVDQIRGAMRAAAFGDIWIMMPMISHVEQVLHAKEIIEQCGEELRQRGVPYGEIKIGVMVEIPSSCLIADRLADEIDFFSIGTNDLTQYTLAVDRTNVKVSDLYQEMHPSIIKLMSMVVKIAKQRNKPISICGELASNPNALPVLIGLGIDKLCMNSYSIYQIKKAIADTDFKMAQNVAKQVKKCSNLKEVNKILCSQLNVKGQKLLGE